MKVTWCLVFFIQYKRVEKTQNEDNNIGIKTSVTRDRSAEAEKKPTDAHNNVHDISDITVDLK